MIQYSKRQQRIIEEKISEYLVEILKAGTEGNITVLGMLVYDIRNREISLSTKELADLIVQPNGIHIIF